MIHNECLMRKIVHGYRSAGRSELELHGLDRERVHKIVDRIECLPEYNSVELLYDLVKHDLITFDEFYLMLGPAIRQPEMLEKRYEAYLELGM